MTLLAAVTRPIRKALLVFGVTLAVCSALTALRLTDPWLLTVIRERTFDAYQRVRPRAYNDFPVRIVDIDERSLAAFGQWPWPRDRLAELTRRLQDLGASVITYDVIFAEPDRLSPALFTRQLRHSDEAKRVVQEILAHLPDNDEAFAEAIAQSPVALGFATVASPNAQRPPVKASFAFAGQNPTSLLDPFVGTAMNIPSLTVAAAGLGSVSLNSGETGGIVRRIPLLSSDGRQVYPSLALEALRLAFGGSTVVVRSTGASREADYGNPGIVELRVGELTIPLTSRGELWIYYDRNRSDRYVSVSDVLDPAKEEQVRAKVNKQIVFVGTSAAGLLDNRVTSLGEEVPGVAIHAQAVEQILAQDFLRRPDWAGGLEIFVALFLGLLISVLLYSLGPQSSFLIGGALTASIVAALWFAFTQAGLLLDPLYPAASGLGVHLAVSGVLYIASDRERRFVRQAFGQYLAPELLARLENSPESLKLGGEAREITIMFMDVRGFTPLSQRLSPPQLIEFLNGLFSPLTEAIQEEQGTIDKYIGDSIMAFWNAPLDIPGHPARACRAGLKMLEAARTLVSTDAFGFRARGLSDLEVKIGIGINTGEAFVGNIGSRRRFNYSVIGDAVNTAARIESSCKEVGASLLISEATAARASSFALLEVGDIALKGKSRPEKLFAVIGDETMAQTEGFRELAESHRTLLDAVAVGRIGPGLVALERCRRLADQELQPLYDRCEQELRTAATRSRPTVVQQHGL
jgi:adenylate cyclase